MHNNTNDYAIADSGTTRHFLQMDSVCEDKKQASNGVCVQLSDGSSIESTQTALINFPQLPLEAHWAHLFPHIKHALLSISMLCDHEYTAIFDEDGVYIVKHGHITMHGFRYPVTIIHCEHEKREQSAET